MNSKRIFGPAAVFCVLILAAAGCSQARVSGQAGTRVAHGKPRLPVDAKLEMVGETDSAGQTRFRLSVTADIDFQDAEITIKLPKNGQLVDGALSWKGALKAGRLHQMAVTALVPDKPNYRVTADIILLQTDKAKLKKRVALNVHMGKPTGPDRTVKTGHKHKAVPLEEFLQKKKEG